MGCLASDFKTVNKVGYLVYNLLTGWISESSAMLCEYIENVTFLKCDTWCVREV